MSLQEAFLKAVDSDPRSPLVTRVRKAIRRGGGSRTEDARLQAVAPERLAYGFDRVGRRWAGLRLGGCSWTASLDILRAEWKNLLVEMQAVRPAAAQVELLHDFSLGLGLRCEELDRRGRGFLIGLVASRAGDCADVGRIDGVPWLSPATVLVEAVNDLESHCTAQRQTLRDFLSSHAALQAQNAHDARMRELCVALRLWLGRPAQRANVAADKVLTP